MRFVVLFLTLPFLLFACSTDEDVKEDTAVECGDDTGTPVDTGDTADTADTAIDPVDTGADTGDTGDTATDPVDTGADTGTSDTGTEDTGGDTAETPPA
jgi:hypothetical protein